MIAPGELLAVAGGSTTLEATWQDLRATVEICVFFGRTERPLRFRNDVLSQS